MTEAMTPRTMVPDAERSEGMIPEFMEAVARKFRKVTRQRLAENEAARTWRHIQRKEVGRDA